jgi:hypothetical protein
MLSMMQEPADMESAYDDDVSHTKNRLGIMNLAVNLDKRIRNLFELAEREVLAAVCSQNMQIAPYTPVYHTSE